MPLRLKDPRQGKSPNFSVRGTYLGVRVDKSCGTHKRSVAQSVLKRLEEAIERGEYPRKEAIPGREQPTFLSAAVAYMEAGRSREYIAKLIKHFGEAPLVEIDQRAIDGAAAAIYPNVTPATRNRCVYTPVSAVLHHAGVDIKIRRPKGGKGRVVTDWLSETDATAIIRQAEAINREFALLLRFLLYTGARLGEALSLRWEAVQLDDSTAWIGRTKNGDPRTVKLRTDLCADLRAHSPREPHRRVFRFHQGGHLKHFLTRAKLAALGLSCPARRPTGWRAPPCRLSWVNFHSFRHTFSTWFRKYGRGDIQGLVGTGNWRDARSAARYAHVVAHEEWLRVDAFPSVDDRKKA